MVMFMQDVQYCLYVDKRSIGVGRRQNGLVGMCLKGKNDNHGYVSSVCLCTTKSHNSSHHAR